MIISKVQHTIDSLEKSLSEAFIFILDTTDRSFMYKSSGRQDCSERIEKVDHIYGIDQVMSDRLFHIHKENGSRLLLKKIDLHAFLGVFLCDNEYTNEMLNKASNILNE